MSTAAVAAEQADVGYVAAEGALGAPRCEMDEAADDAPEMNDSFEEAPLDLLAPEVALDVDEAPVEFKTDEADPEELLMPVEHNGNSEEAGEVEHVDDSSKEHGDVEVIEGHEEGEGDYVESIYEVKDEDQMDYVSNDAAEANQENENPDQIPEPLSAEEQPMYDKIFGPGQQAVQFLRIHCTACNEHLGSAPHNQHRRYIHPLLKVTICKNCYDFYGSGDFDKDEDGSELYCRWCGQGGNVLCCAQCPYVFCQRCIRTNLGKRVLAKIKESDDWTCFACKPEPIYKLRVICRALYEYVQQEIQIAAELKQSERLKVDKSMCCHSKPKILPIKRKYSTELYNPFDEEEQSKQRIKTNILSHASVAMKENKQKQADSSNWESQAEDEVVCTPDLSMLMDDDDTPAAASSPPPTSPSPEPSFSVLHPSVAYKKADKDSDVQFVSQTKIVGGKNKVLPVQTINRNFKLPALLKSKPILLNRVQAPNKGQASAPSTFTGVVKVCQPSGNTVGKTTFKLVPGMRYDWFDKAAQVTARVNQNLTSRICSLFKAQSNMASLEELASIHNNLQEILSNSIHSLLQIRKNLRNDFLISLKKMKASLNQEQATQASADDDVIIVDSNTPTIKSDQNDKGGGSKHGYIKVKPVSELLASSSIITVPDDTAPSNNKMLVLNTNPAILSGGNIVIASAPASEVELVKSDVILNGEITSNTNEYVNSTSENIDKALPQESEVCNSEIENLVGLDTIINENMKYKVADTPPDVLRRMLSVQVCLETNFGSKTLREMPLKGYTPLEFELSHLQEEGLEQTPSPSNSVPEPEEETLQTFDNTQSNDMEDASSPLLDSRDTSLEDGVEGEGATQLESEPEESLQDPPATDSGIDVDGDHSLSNGIASCQAV